jgi:cell division septum initiation protein DivIVA
MDEIVSLKRREWEEFLRDNERIIKQCEMLLEKIAELEKENKELRDKLQAAEAELRELKGAQPPAPFAQRAPALVKKRAYAVSFCIYCGRRLVPAAAYCDMCGSMVEREPRASSLLERLKLEWARLTRRIR